MKIFLFFLTFFACSIEVFAGVDTLVIPLQRRYFHDKVDAQQKMCDKADGKLDGAFRVGNNEEVNLRLSDALFRKIDDLQIRIEKNDSLPNSNQKVKFLSYLENVLREFRITWKKKEINALELPALMQNFETIMDAQVKGESMLPFIEKVSYPIAKINSDIFYDNPGYTETIAILYYKYSLSHPEKVLKTIRPFVDASFADTLIALAAVANPVQLYSYAQSTSSPEGRLIHRSENRMVKAIANLTNTENALFYFPFLDDLLSGKKTIDSIKKYVEGARGYDSVGYFKLLVRTEINYYTRLTSAQRDTPIAMFGANGLRESLRSRALEHFIKPINELHDQSNLTVRMRAIEPLSAVELYFMIVMGENDIYTSSYKHSFNRMLLKMGNNARTDSLLLSVNFDFFKKFIKMAANYNKLDSFIRRMPTANSEALMKYFVANLDKGNNLEDATDVADSYSSITDKKILKTILDNVRENEAQSLSSGNIKGTIVYGLLREIFLSADSTNKIDLTASLGIPSIYAIENKNLRDDSGRIVQQVFFYGDEDGKLHFPGFISSFSSKEWRVTKKTEWYEIRSVKGNVWIFVNRPLDNDANLDDSAQVHLTRYLEAMELHPAVVVHRGHSYWLPGTIDRMPGDAKIVVLGSCGGYKNLNQILEICPDAHIISTKEIGTGQITQPIQNYLSQAMATDTKIVWKDMWQTLSRSFARDSREKRESWEDYIPPYRNLAAIFIKAYNKKLESM